MTQEVGYADALVRAAAVAALVQGEVLGVADACVVIGDAAMPMSAEVATAAADSGITDGLVLAPHVVDDVVLLTQTCDLQETTAEERLCIVAPVRRVAAAIARQALRGRLPRLVALPWLDEESVADLSLITTVERAVLVGAASRGRPDTPDERLHFADAVARYLTRPALPDHINNVLVPFLKRIKDKHDRDSPEGHCLEKVAEFRLEATPDIDADAPALMVLVLLEETDLPALPGNTAMDNERIDALAQQGHARAADAALQRSDPIQKREAWTALAALTGAVGSVDVAVLNGEELSYARSRNTPVLDLQYLSTRPD